MDIERFMQGYRAAWEGRDESLFCALFAADGEYHNTPFAVQRGHAQLAAYWQRVKLQEDVHVVYQVLARTTGTNTVACQPGDPLPKMVLDGVLQAEFEGGLCKTCRLWWHSLPLAA